MKKLISSISIFSLISMGFLATPAQGVVGGTDATGSGFVVAIRVDLGSDFQTACTGGLWKPNIVVTAAHCVVEEGSTNVYPASSIHIYAQGTNLTNTRPVANASAVIVTEGYKNSSNGYVQPNDIAFLVLDKEIGIPLVTRLASEAEVAGATAAVKKMYFFGYGQTAAKSDVSMIPLTLSQTPSQYLGAKTYLYGKTAANSGACFGDSGGPVILQTETENLLIGPVAGGSGTPCYPELKTRAVLSLVASGFTSLAKQALALAGYPAEEAVTIARPDFKKKTTYSAKTAAKRLGYPIAASTSVSIVGLKAKPAAACSATASKVIAKSKGTCTVTFSVKKKGKAAKTVKTSFSIK